MHEPAGARPVDRHSATVRLPANAAAAGRTIGDFALERTLGEGSSGTVFAARHRRSGQVVALKVLRMPVAAPDQLPRFWRECALTAALDHPGIVRVLDSGFEQLAGLATPYIAYELVDGKPFAQALAGRPLPTILRAFAAVCEAIDYAHGRGILHRDLKSANVLVDESGRPRVVDFGIGTTIGVDQAQATRTGQVLGSFATMSPEQAAGRPVDARADVYALGALLFEAVSGSLPHDFTGASESEVLRRLVTVPARSLLHVLPKADRDLAALVDAALAFARDARYSSVGAMLADVRRMLRGRPVRVRRPTAWQSFGTLVRRHRTLAWSVAAVVGASMLLSAGLVVAYRQAQEVAAAERRLHVGTERMRSAFGLLVRVAAPMVESAPSTGEAHEQLAQLLDQAVRQADAVETGGNPDLLMLQAQ
ncbi:MAG: serine/threonine protein kinase, partial [Planctomycetes bacterium]|nr:serine/threonine protein kinase [Planctomycetota bacterium]